MNQKQFRNTSKILCEKSIINGLIHPLIYINLNCLRLNFLLIIFDYSYD